MVSIGELVDTDLSEARDASTRIAIASKLQKMSKDTADDAERFALLIRACEIAAESGDYTRAANVCSQVNSTFKGGYARHLLSAATGSVENVYRNDLTDFIRMCVSLCVAAVQSDDFESAKKLAEVLKTRLSKEKRLEDVKTGEDVATYVAEAVKRHAKLNSLVVDFQAGKPVSPEQATELGRYLCLTKGDWGVGLAMLCSSNDVKLRPLAMKSLAGAGDPSAKTAIADEWWEIAGNEVGISKVIVQLYAESWYQDALPSLKGLAKARVTKRLNEISGDTHEEDGALVEEWPPQFLKKDQAVLLMQKTLQANQPLGRAYLDGLPNFTVSFLLDAKKPGSLSPVNDCYVQAPLGQGGSPYAVIVMRSADLEVSFWNQTWNSQNVPLPKTKTGKYFVCVRLSNGVLTINVNGREQRAASHFPSGTQASTAYTGTLPDELTNMVVLSRAISEKEMRTLREAAIGE